METRKEGGNEPGKEAGKGSAVEKRSFSESFSQNRASLFREVEGEVYSMKFTDESFVWFLKKPNLRVWQIGPEDGFDRFVAEVDLWRVEGPRNGGFGFYVQRERIGRCMVDRPLQQRLLSGSEKIVREDRGHKKSGPDPLSF